MMDVYEYNGDEVLMMVVMMIVMVVVMIIAKLITLKNRPIYFRLLNLLRLFSFTLR